MGEAQLIIKPTLKGDARGKLRGLRQDVARFHQEQGRALMGAERRVHALERAWDGVGRSLHGTRNLLGRTLGMMGSMQALMLGAGALGAGKTFVDLTIGSNAQLETQLVTFRTMIGDAKKADALMGRLRAYAASTPFAQDDLIEGSKRLLRLTGANIDQNEKLLKVAAQMAAINPTKTISDAAEALLDAEGLEFERLKEFGIKLKKTDVQRAKKRGQTIGQAALAGVESALKKQTGGRDVVGALSQTLSGKISTAKDQLRMTMQRVGEPAFEVLKKGFDEVGAEFDKLGKDAKFKKDLEDLAGLTRDLTMEAIRLGKQLPAAIRSASEGLRSAKKFAVEHQTALKVAGGLYVGDKLTGGALSGGAKNLATRFLMGKGGKLGRAVGAATAMPVFVTNMPSGGLGGLGGAGAGGAAAKATSALSKGSVTGAGSQIARHGALGALAQGGMGAAAVAGGTAIFGSMLLGAWAFSDATNKTAKVMDGFRKQAEQATRARRERESKAAAESVQARNTLFNTRRLIGVEARKLASDVQLGKKSERGALKGRFQRLYDAGRSSGQGADVLTALNRELANQGFQARAGKDGKLTFAAGGLEAEQAKVKRLRAFWGGQDHATVMRSDTLRKQFQEDNAYVKRVVALERQGKERAAQLNAATGAQTGTMSPAEMRMLAGLMGDALVSGLKSAGLTPQQFLSNMATRQREDQSILDARGRALATGRGGGR